MRSRRQAGLARLYGATALGVPVCLRLPACPGFRAGRRRSGADGSGRLADAAGGRHAGLRQRRPDGDRRRRRADRLWRQPPGRPARHLRPQDQAADRQRQCPDRRQRRHQDLFRTDRHHRRFRRRLRQRVARRDRRQDLFRRRKRRAHGRRADDVPQRRLHRLRTVRGQAGQGADLAHQGAARSSGTARRRRFASRIRDFEFFGFPIAYLPRSRSPTRRSSARAAS